MNTAGPFDAARARGDSRAFAQRIWRVGFTAGLGGALLFALGLLMAPRQAFFSWLAAWSWATSIAFGALALVMISHAATAEWFVVLRRAAEAIALAVLPLALLFLPVLIGMRDLYPWMRPPTELSAQLLEAVEKKRAWLNAPFFIARAVVYLGAWSTLALLLGGWSARQDEEADPALTRRMRALSAAGLVVVGLTVTFAAIDWLMSLTPRWYSTIFGFWWFTGGFSAALGLLAIVAWRAQRAGPLAGVLEPAHFHALGRLMLMSVPLWAYMAFSQLLIVWIGNVPEEAEWYIARTTGGWGAVGLVLIFGHFALPFFVLLSRALKHRPARLAAVGAWLLLMHLVDVWWVVMPSHHERLALHWLDLACPLAVGGLTAGFAAVLASRRAAIPIHDPDLAASIAYESR